MKHLQIEQNSPEWFAAKLGKPSASGADKIITMDGKPSKQREGYLYELAAERIRQQRHESYFNAEMQEGIEREAESRKLYELMHDCEIQPGGLCLSDDERICCSPDGLMVPADYAARCGLELKNPLPKTQVKYLLAGTLPSEYFQQVQFSLFVTGFDRWDFMSYCGGLNPLILQVGRDEKFLKALSIEVELFCNELDQIVERLK